MKHYIQQIPLGVDINSVTVPEGAVFVNVRQLPDYQEITWEYIVPESVPNMLANSKDCMKLCPKCKALLNYYDYFCIKCGYDFNDPPT